MSARLSVRAAASPVGAPALRLQATAVAPPAANGSAQLRGRALAPPRSNARGHRLSVRAATEETETEEEPTKRLKWWEKDMHPNMVDITSMDQFLEQMSDAGDRLVIVDFYAHWCHACRGLYPRLARLMKDNPDILLLKVEFDSNKTITKSLGIKVLPYFHFYRGTNGKVAAFSASLKKLDRLKEAIEEHNGPDSNVTGIVYESIKDVLENTPESV